VDSALWAQKNSERDFDGLIIFWYAGIDSDPKQLWDSKSADISGSNNYTGFKDEEADAIFERLTETFDYEARIKLMHRWYEIQYREQPYTWIWSVHSPILVNADWRVPEPKLDAPYVDRRLVFRWKNRK
jgi:ABC-type transport system substrate-binding protein